MVLGRIYNEDCFEALADIANECERPVIVTDPPKTWHHEQWHDLCFFSLAQMLSEYPSVLISNQEDIIRLSDEMHEEPLVMPWACGWFQRDIAFWRIRPDTSRTCELPDDSTGMYEAMAYDVVCLIKSDEVTVIDPFAGFGAVVVACQRLGVPWRAIDVDAERCVVIERRVEAL